MNDDAAKLKGTIGLMPILVTGVITVLTTLGGAYITASAAASNQLYETKLAVQKSDSELDGRIIRLETDIPYIKTGVTDLKDDINDIKKALNIKP